MIDTLNPYNLQRFVDAQNELFGRTRSTIFEKACQELRNGRKQEHWMWFVFPQVKGLGESSMSRKFAIASRAEAEAYLKHPVLGPRLRECTRLMNGIEGRTAGQILGRTDELKFRSSMTLFAHATPDNQVFVDALKKYFQGEFDGSTLAHLGDAGS